MRQTSRLDSLPPPLGEQLTAWSRASFERLLERMLADQSCWQETEARLKGLGFLETVTHTPGSKFPFARKPYALIRDALAADRQLVNEAAAKFAAFLVELLGRDIDAVDAVTVISADPSELSQWLTLMQNQITGERIGSRLLRQYIKRAMDENPAVAAVEDNFAGWLDDKRSSAELLIDAVAMRIQATALDRIGLLNIRIASEFAALLATFDER